MRIKMLQESVDLANQSKYRNAIDHEDVSLAEWSVEVTTQKKEEPNKEHFEKCLQVDVHSPSLIHLLKVDLQLTQGQRIMVAGLNGVGKTAISRVLKGIWPGKGKMSFQPHKI